MTPDPLGKSSSSNDRLCEQFSERMAITDVRRCRSKCSEWTQFGPKSITGTKTGTMHGCSLRVEGLSVWKAKQETSVHRE